MEEHLRFTGENPPLRLWTQYPNWQNAYDEEGLPDQDETTLRPSDNQHTIDDDVSFTAGIAVLANGQSVPALLGMVAGNLDAVYVYPAPPAERCWLLSADPLSRRWIAMNQDWLLQAGDMLRVPVGDTSVFPLRVRSRLPLLRTHEAIAVEIRDPV
jgi:hypothetical protein